MDGVKQDAGADGHGRTGAAKALVAGQHALFALLMGVAVVRSALHDARPGWVVVAALAMTGWYVLGVPLSRRARTGPIPWWWVPAWFTVLVTGWAGLVAASREFSWVAFALYLLAMHVLPRRWALSAVAVIMTAVLAAQPGAPAGPGQVLGPVIGALVAVGVAVGYQRVIAESEERRRLLADLISTQEDLVSAHDELAQAQRRAGALAERARLARDIHDTLAQGFSSIILLSRAGLGESPAPATDRQRDLLARIEAVAVENLDEARRVVHALAPAPLEEAPLPAALDRLVTRFQEQCGVEAGFTVDGTTQVIPASHEIALLRFAQGALANVRQHARAGRVAVTLSYLPGSTGLDVVDDGIGFAPEEAHRQAVENRRPDGSGFGLRAMRERLADVGGTLVVETEPGEGTALSAMIPLPVATDPQQLRKEDR
ncbi:Signal transduction histidine kinase [Austwickia chelonae]|uniref:Oxygen sensor histidine kinase NreB n=1 Tax=Austwickia chelonae NBRC 105200 TaxID=1184607 RepID=K6W9V6_9MICO|nr:sensor histidine kinase [Austwickia chelonae]GAB78612.1 putative two-component histidine kinase [Austwickia chelonae NBRC 105200]SEW34120.1 Signal transduction histidine kinase [Austwickia chelonae]